MTKINLLPPVQESVGNLQRHFEIFRKRVAAPPDAADDVRPDTGSLGLVPSGTGVPEEVPSGTGVPEMAPLGGAPFDGAPFDAAPSDAVSIGALPTRVADVVAIPSAAAQETPLPPWAQPPNWREIDAVLGEKVRLADYTEQEREQLEENYPPQLAAALLTPQYTLRERLAALSVTARGVLALIALLLLTGLGWVLHSTAFSSGTQVAPGADHAVANGATGNSAAGDSVANSAAAAAAASSAAGFSAPGEFSPQIAGAKPAGSKVFVHVVGEVQQPGVYELQAGSRAQDALTAAGGPTEQAQLAVLNLARVLQDGEQLVVPNTATAAQLPPAPPPTDPGAPLNLNTATQQQLEQLPQIGPNTAANIISWRDSNGGFHSLEQLLEVNGIGEKTLAVLRAHLTV